MANKKPNKKPNKKQGRKILRRLQDKDSSFSDVARCVEPEPVTLAAVWNVAYQLSKSKNIIAVLAQKTQWEEDKIWLDN